jgi:ATP-dependent DNA helicase PIF1
MLNEGQERALKVVKEGQSCFISGPGGTGKSYLISHIVKEIRKSLKKVEVTALTGCAALLLGNRAKTIHSWAGIGLGRDTAHVLAMGMKKYNNRAFRRWLLTDVLIIDEISMMDPVLLDKLDEIGRIIRRSEKPFGGIQMVFVGDFFQLPPVRKREEQEEEQPPEEFAKSSEGTLSSPRVSVPRPEFSFESKVWQKMNPTVILLIEIVRQSDPVFQGVLNEIRFGKISQESLDILNARKLDSWQTLEIRPTLLFSRRAEVEMINDKNMRALPKDGAMTFHAHTDFTAVLEKGLTKESERVKRAIEKLDLNAPYKPSLELRIGAQVMLLTNMDVENGLVNGSRGIVTGFSEGVPKGPLVLFLGRSASIPVPEASWESEDIEGLKRTQIPLMCAWALTIHKSQGATLDSALIDVGSRTFERGQAYVALSRVKSLESLYIWDLEPAAFKAHPKVVKYYEELG